jgi:hypothetical protein
MRAGASRRRGVGASWISLSAGICSCSSRLGPLGLLTDSGRERVQPRNHRLTVKHAPGWGERGKLRVRAPKSADRHWAARFRRPLYSDRDSSGRVMQDPLNKADRYCKRAAGARCPEAPRCGTVGTPIRFYSTPSMLMASARRSSNGRNWATSGPRYSLIRSSATRARPADSGCLARTGNASMQVMSNSNGQCYTNCNVKPGRISRGTGREEREVPHIIWGTCGAGRTGTTSWPISAWLRFRRFSCRARLSWPISGTWQTATAMVAQTARRCLG